MHILNWWLCVLCFAHFGYADPSLPDSVNYCLDNKTLPIPMPTPCLSLKTKGCLDLTVEFKLANKTIFGPKDIPLKFILQSQERGLCQPTDLLPGVVFCGNITSLKYTKETRNLAVCVTLSAVFPLIGTKSFPIPCFNISKCEFPRDCLNGCSGFGTCELGACRCNPGHYGMDCGAKLEGNCISQGGKTTCWNITEPRCRHIDIELIENAQPKEHLERLVMTNEAIDVEFPCRRNLSDLTECIDCLSLRDVLVVGNQLRGSPSVSLTCGGVPVHTQKFPLATLVENLATCPSPQAPNVPVPTSQPVAQPIPSGVPISTPVEPPTDEGWIDKAKENKGALIIGAVVIVVIVIALMGVGFYFYKRCSKQARTGAYQTVSSVDPFDGTPMQDDADAINYSFSQSDDDQESE